MIIRPPQTKKEFADYYHLRWRLLRQPWGEAEVTERDDNEEDYYHLMAIEGTTVIAVARLEFPSMGTAQLRYMAVDELVQKQGIGRLIIAKMESYAKKKNTSTLFLNARENAVGFYEKLNYQTIEKSYLLFNSIQHYKMIKTL